MLLAAVYATMVKSSKESNVGDTGDIKVAIVIGANKETYTNTGRTCGKTYYYKVRAYKRISGKTVTSKFSAVKSAYAKPFSVLYSDKASRPNTPVNVMVGALIIKELFNYSDDEMWRT